MSNMKILQNFIQKHESYMEIEHSTPNKLLDIKSDDEVWLLQCPKSLIDDISILKNNKIKLPGKTNMNISELIANESETPTKLILATPKIDKIELNSINIKGSMILRKKLEVKINEEDIIKNKIKVKFPANLKVRHPLHGIHYKDKINLRKSIQDQLKEVNESRLNLKNERIEMQTDYELENIQHKKRKANKSGTISQIQNVKLIKNDDNDESLNWLRNI